MKRKKGGLKGVTRKLITNNIIHEEWYSGIVMNHFFMKPIAFGNSSKICEVRYNIMIRILIQTLSWRLVTTLDLI